MFFKEQIKKRIKNEKGLTLIELLAVIVILAIIAAIAIPAIGNIINNSRDKAVLSEALNVISGAKLAHIENGCGSTDGGCKKAQLDGFVDGITIPDGLVVKLDSTSNVWGISGFPAQLKKEYDGVTVSGTGENTTITATEQVLKERVDK